MMQTSLDHDQLVADMTGGLAPVAVPSFAGSSRLRPDGRPRPEFRAELRRISDPKNALLVLAALLYPFAVIGAAVYLAHLAAWILAFFLMGIYFQRPLTLHHEAAHRLLFSNRVVNDLIGEKFLGALAFGDGSNRYRLAHSQHHRDEFGPREPDFLLYAQYPISRESWHRKLRRDATGVSGWKNIKPVLRGLGQASRRNRSLVFISTQLAIFAIFFTFGQPWLYLALWFAPWMTIARVTNRLRALAEHAGMTRSNDRRLTTHHVRQGFWSRRLFLTQNIGYHLAHHVDSGIPMANLPKFHRALEEDGYLPSSQVHRSYRAMWRTLSIDPA